MKSFVNPPKAISEVLSIIMLIFDFPKKDLGQWDKQKKLLSDIKFFEKMKKYEFDKVKKEKLDQVQNLMDKSTIKGGFNYETIKKVSVPTGSLCNWIQNWHAAGSAVVGFANIKEEMAKLDTRIAFKYHMMETKEQQKLN